MNADLLIRFLDQIPMSFGQRIMYRTGLAWVLEGRDEAAGGFIDALGQHHPGVVVRLLPALIAAGAPPELVYEAVREVVIRHHKALPGLVAAAGGRTTFASWCRRAGFTLPDHLVGDPVTVARGTHGCTPEENAAGMHWAIGATGSDPFDEAAFFAFGRPGSVVVTACVPRSALVYYVPGILPAEVLLEDVPPRYQVVTDQAVITAGAVRFAHYRRDLVCDLPFDPMGNDFDRTAADLIAWNEARAA